MEAQSLPASETGSYVIESEPFTEDSSEEAPAAAVRIHIEETPGRHACLSPEAAAQLLQLNLSVPAQAFTIGLVNTSQIATERANRDLVEACVVGQLGGDVAHAAG